MAKELMEIGGFITEGAEIVNHDASLSGNGTVDSPLGLNETVLWENTTPTNSAVLSETKDNFERIRILIGNGSNTATFGQWHEISTSSTVVPIVRGKGENNLWLSWIRLQYNTATDAYYIPSAKSFNFGNVTATAWSNPSVTVNNNEDVKSIYKVVGVNRISG